MNRISTLAKKCFSYFLHKRGKNSGYKSYGGLFTKMKQVNPHLFNPVEMEAEWVEKWSKYDIKFSPDTIRVFSKFIGEDINVFPLEFFPYLIEPVLSPSQYRMLYEEKNLYDVNLNILKKKYSYDILPKTLYRCINGILMSEDYRIIDDSDVDNIVLNQTGFLLKPSIDSGSGNGILFYTRKVNENLFYDQHGSLFDFTSLKKRLAGNYICQSIVNQSEEMSLFNPTSLNTLRVMLYKSVKDNEVKVLHTVLRMGAKGSRMDNAHSGGVFCGVSKEGKLNKYVCDWLGTKYTNFNDVDFSKENLFIPNIDDVISFSKDIGDTIHHSRLIALDIALNNHNQPLLVEINASGFAAWIFTFSTGSYFEQYTDEVVEYCNEEIRKNKYLYFNY